MPQIRKKTAEQSKRMMTQFAMREYSDLVSYRDKVDDCLQGQACIKSKPKYLPPSKWQIENPEEYKAYVRRALFYSLTAYAMRIYEGLAMAGKPTVILPKDKRMDFIAKVATIHKRDLHDLQYNLNREQMAHGLRCMLLNPTDDNARPFLIQELGANAYLTGHFIDDGNGFSKAKMVLLNVSRDEFNMKTKRYEFHPKLMVLGLDANDEYYQAILDVDEWADFDIEHPSHPTLVYPSLWGMRSNVIPFTWCNASSLSGTNIDIPPLLDMCDCELKLYELDAMFSQHLFQSAQETVFFTNAPGNFDLSKVRYGCGAHNTLLQGMDVKVISNNGIGFQAQKEYMDSIMAQIELRRMSIMSSKSHQSGTAVGIVQSAQTAPLRTIIETSGAAITEQLRYMAKWMGYDDDDILKTLYTPSQTFAHVDTNISEFVALCNAVAEGTVPMLDSDLYKFAISNGFVNSKVEWEDFRKRWIMEKENRLDNLSVLPTGKNKPPKNTTDDNGQNTDK